MATDTNLRFIREKIYEIRSAVMYSMSNGLVKIPNNIVTLLKIDDEGQLWFVCTAPAQRVEECEPVFPARLHFYKKGKFFHVEVSGRASIVSHQYQGPIPGGGETARKPVLIKMSMLNIEYTSLTDKKEKGKLEELLEQAYKWILRNLALPRHEKPVFPKLHQSH